MNSNMVSLVSTLGHPTCAVLPQNVSNCAQSLCNFRIGNVVNAAGLPVSKATSDDLLTLHMPRSFKHKIKGFKHNSKLDSCNDRIQKTKNQLLSCPAARKLWDEVETDGKIKLRCVTENEAPFGARSELRKMSILISKDLTKKMLWHMVFELSNLKQVKPLKALANEVCKLKMDDFAISRERVEYDSLINAIKIRDTMEDFAISRERVEYDSLINAIKIRDTCVKNQFWPKGENIDEYRFSDFKSFIEVQESSGHTDAYREDWLMMCLFDREWDQMLVLNQMLDSNFKDEL
jgi:hypothetical protein